MTTFREPTGELPKPFYLSSGRVMLCIDEPTDMLTHEAEALLRVLLDICPNAEALAHNWLLDRQKTNRARKKSPSVRT